ncbi:MAG: septum formation initiator family protein [Solirubrobacteraceae bacterium]
MSSSTAYSARRPVRRSTARRDARRGPGLRWDRLGRVALLSVLVVLVYLYVSAGVALLGSWSASRTDRAHLVTLEREHATLAAQRTKLERRYNIEAQARLLGMARPGEKQFIVSHLPSD